MVVAEEIVPEAEGAGEAGNVEAGAVDACDRRALGLGVRGEGQGEEEGQEQFHGEGFSVWGMIAALRVGRMTKGTCKGEILKSFDLLRMTDPL